VLHNGLLFFPRPLSIPEHARELDRAIESLVPGGKVETFQVNFCLLKAEAKR